LGVNGVHIANQNNVLNAPHSEYFWLRVALRWVWAHSRTAEISARESAAAIATFRDQKTTEAGRRFNVSQATKAS
jgi:hypothetical protein